MFAHEALGLTVFRVSLPAAVQYASIVFAQQDGRMTLNTMLFSMIYIGAIVLRRFLFSTSVEIWSAEGLPRRHGPAREVDSSRTGVRPLHSRARPLGLP